MIHTRFIGTLPDQDGDALSVEVVQRDEMLCSGESRRHANPSRRMSSPVCVRSNGDESNSRALSHLGKVGRIVYQRRGEHVRPYG